MNVLLDTHALLWFTLGERQLSVAAREAIDHPSNRVLVSPASYWELAIKVSLGRIELQGELDAFLAKAIKGNGFRVLPIESQHAILLATLPYHHRDPFDRTLVAQALVEGIPLVSADRELDSYGVVRIW